MGNLDNLQEMAQKQLSALGDAMKLAEQAINSLPIECKNAFPMAQYDINQAKEMLNKGDSTGLTDLVKKYSNPSEILMRKDANSTTK